MAVTDPSAATTCAGPSNVVAFGWTTWNVTDSPDFAFVSLNVNASPSAPALGATASAGGAAGWVAVLVLTVVVDALIVVVVPTLNFLVELPPHAAAVTATTAITMTFRTEHPPLGCSQSRRKRAPLH